MIIVTGENGQKMKRLQHRAASTCAKHFVFNEMRLLAEQTVKADLWIPYCNLPEVASPKSAAFVSHIQLGKSPYKTQGKGRPIQEKLKR